MYLCSWGVEPYDLVAAFFGGLGLGGEGCSVVAGEFGGAGATGGGPDGSLRIATRETGFTPPVK